MKSIKWDDPLGVGMNNFTPVDIIPPVPVSFLEIKSVKIPVYKDDSKHDVIDRINSDPDIPYIVVSYEGRLVLMRDFYFNEIRIDFEVTCDGV